MDRPYGCRFWEAADIIEWIKANVPAEDQPSGPEVATRWWKACVDAESMMDLNFREMAELCMDGSKATDLQDVTDEIQAPYQDEDPQDWTKQFIAEQDDNIETMLRDHFNIKKEAHDPNAGS